MDKNKILQADLLDIVFDQRNKVYGAYMLRRTYHQRLKRSAIAALSFVSAVLLIPILSAFHPEPVAAKKPYVLIPVETILDVPKPENPEVKIQEQQKDPDMPVIKNTLPEIVHTQDNVDPPPTQEELAEAASGLVNQEGEGKEPTGTVELNTEGSGTSLVAVEGPTSIPEETTYSTESGLDILPSFPGGDEAMMEYLQSNIKYPNQAREDGKEGKVVVSFVVDKDGSLTLVKLINGNGYGMDEEAMRVIKKMPKWKPGTMNGHPVKVEFYLPLVFELNQ